MDSSVSEPARGGGPRAQRARRSVQRQPALVDRSDLSEDALGRVEIFSIPVDTSPSPARRSAGRQRAATERVGRLLDSEMAPVATLALLVIVFWIGLLLTH